MTPLFAIGATLGVFLAPDVRSTSLVVAAIGYASVFGSATTLLAPILIGGEVFGYANLPFFVIACAIAYCLPKSWSIILVKKLRKSKKELYKPEELSDMIVSVRNGNTKYSLSAGGGPSRLTNGRIK